MLIVIVRCVIMYCLIILIVRLMGKRQIGELQPSDLVITILMSELASMPIQDRNIPILWAVIPILVLAVLEIVVSLFVLKSVKFRTVIYGNPLVLMYNGQFRQKEMEKARVTIDDVLENMRNNGITSLEQVDYVVLETNGQLSIIEKKETSCGLPYLLIIDGKIMYDNLKKCKVDMKWLESHLKKNNINSIKEVFLMTLNDNNDIYLVPKK